MNEKYTLIGQDKELLATYEEIIKKSKFITYVYNIQEENEANEIIDSVKKKHKEARHIVFAYRLENTGRFTDDREPSGTAGKPIYAMLEKENLINVLVIVVRYFGGILLGTGPLTRAYLGGAISSISMCNKDKYIKYTKTSYVVEYNEEKEKIREIEKKNGKILEISYGEKVNIHAQIPQKESY